MMTRIKIAGFLALSLAVVTGCHDAEKKPDTEGLSSSVIQNPYTADGGIDTNALETMPVIVFKDTLHDFGTLKEGEVGNYEFDFTNTGKSPLLISGANASCGCTVADYPRDPIPPGQGGSLKVSFNSAGKPGHQEKSIAVKTNAVGGLKNLYIRAEVAPQN